MIVNVLLCTCLVSPNVISLVLLCGCERKESTRVDVLERTQHTEFPLSRYCILIV